MLRYIVPIIFLLTSSNAQNSYGCEIGWRLFNQYCYRALDIRTQGVETSTVTFDATLDYCRSNGADPTSITSAFENSFIQTNLSLVTGFRYWIGLQIRDQTYSWIDGTPFSYNNLNVTTVGNGESLSAYFSPGQQWTAEPSSVLLEGSICKRPAIPNMPARYNGSALGYSSAHDPTILKTPDGQYVVYATNMNIPGSISNDHQTFYLNGTAFPEGLPWTVNWTGGQQCYWVFDSEGRRAVAAANVSTCLWCPDTSYHNGKYWMYYAASVLYTKIGAIGLATSTTGRPGDWTDHGPVFNSVTANYSAIDPNLFVDDDGTWYLTFGSFNSGIWQYEMDPNTGFIKEGTQIVKLASNRAGGIEASGLWKKGKYYYLANSSGGCCKGLQSSYKTLIHRATSPKGPFYDKAGTPALNGGGSELMVSEFPIIGPGGTYTFQDINVDLLVYHYYDGLNNGKPRLGINSLGYTDDGWPYVY